MVIYVMTEAENQLAQIIWDQEPVGSGQLVKLAGERLNWKKSTTYTVLRRLCERGLFQNEGGVVTALIGREEFAGRQSREFVDETFGGSLPKFLAAFTSRKKLSAEEVEQLQPLIDESRG